MRADYRVVLDACILAPANLCDLFLRLAQTPRLYVPLWTREILEEVFRTQIQKLGFEESMAKSWGIAVREHFPEAEVSDYEGLISVCTNDEKDRHILAAAIRGKAELIVTTNLKDFPNRSTEPFNIRVKHPADYLLTLYSIDPGVFMTKFHEAAANRGVSAKTHLAKLGRSVPVFAGELSKQLGWELELVLKFSK